MCWVEYFVIDYCGIYDQRKRKKTEASVLWCN